MMGRIRCDLGLSDPFRQNWTMDVALVFVGNAWGGRGGRGGHQRGAKLARGGRGQG